MPRDYRVYLDDILASAGTSSRNAARNASRLPGFASMLAITWIMIFSLPIKEA